MNKFLNLVVVLFCSVFLFGCSSQNSEGTENSEAKVTTDGYTEGQVVDILSELYGKNRFKEGSSQSIQDERQNVGVPITTIYFDSTNKCNVYIFENSMDANRFLENFDEANNGGEDVPDMFAVKNFSLVDRNLVIVSFDTRDWFKEKREQPCLNKWKY